MPEEAILLFDGFCPLCCGAVRFVLRRDPAGRFRFAPLQSETGRTLLARHGLRPDAADTFVLIEAERCLTRSDAALAVARRLSAPWPALRLLGVLPRAFRDACYDFIARRRHRWFGRREACMVPDEGVSDRFLE